MGLKDLSENGNYLILAFDHREKYKKYINPEFPDEVTDQEIGTSIKKIINSLQGDFTGILLDEKYSLSVFRETQIEKPFLLPLEDSESETSNNERADVFSSDYSNFNNLEASGVKLLIHYDPNSANIDEKLQKVTDAINKAHENNMPILLGIIPEDTENAERVLNSVQVFTDKNILPDIFAVEFPGSEYLCQRLSSILGVTPWILVTGAADFTLFQEQLRMACENGCRGFLAGRSLWQEYFEIKDTIIKEQFLQKILPLRFEKIRDIVLKS